VKKTFQFKNTHKFRESAIHFEKHKTYPDGGLDSTHEYYEYWDEERDRCLNGYEVDGVWISGYHYFYLNFCKIERVVEVEVNGKLTPDRRTEFPKFWDLDWEFFTALHIARHGMSLEAYEKLPYDIGAKTDDGNLDGGKHFLYLAARGVGKSYKQGAIAAYRYFFGERAATFLIAGDKQFLSGDGVFTKFWNYRNFINENTPYTQYSDVKNDFGGLHSRASYKDHNGFEQGKLNEVIGVTVGDGNFSKLRGKRGFFIIEEVGSLKGADVLWETIKPGTQEGASVYGQLIAMGTGGDISAGAEFMEKAFFGPHPFGILRFENIWDDGLIGMDCAFFRPAYYNVDFIDKDGNTDLTRATEFFEKERLIIAKSKDPMDAIRAKSQNPFTPSEALLRSDSSIFPKAQLLTWKQELISTGKMHNLATHGYLEDTAKGVKFKPSEHAKPVVKYPHDRREDNSGCITVWDTPFRNQGVIPDHLYLICVDPYMHDSTTGDSLGAAYVIKNINGFSQPDDIIVASYVGRPATIDVFHKNVRQLAEYYNAKIGFENNAGQALLAYFKTHRKMHLLAPEFSLGFNENIPKTSVRRGYGMHIDKLRKDIGLGYLADWLNKEWVINEEGDQLYNYNKIYDVGLLEELIKFNPDSNVDRISALMIGMFHQQEVHFKYGNKAMIKTQSNDFFNTVHYQ